MPLDPTPGDPWHDSINDNLPSDDPPRKDQWHVFWLVIGIVATVIGILVVL
jgi:hypothetical protein